MNRSLVLIVVILLAIAAALFALSSIDSTQPLKTVEKVVPDNALTR